MIVQFKNFSYRYPGTSEPVLRNLSFDVRQGEVLGVLGPVGAGKTTLARALGKIVPDILGGTSSGEMIWQGDPNIPVGVVFEDYGGQLSQLKVIDELRVPLRNRGLQGEEQLVKARELLEQVNLNPDELAERYIWELSGGQQQRLAIAATLAMTPQMLVLDGVQRMLDYQSKTTMRHLLHSLRGACTLVLIDDDAQFLQEIADRLLVLIDGQVEAVGDARDILQQTQLLKNADVNLPLTLRVAAELGWPQHPLTSEEFKRVAPELAKAQHGATHSKNKPQAGVAAEFKNVEFAYEREKPLLQRMNFSLRQSAVHALVGPSGAGKTTIAKLFAGLLKPSSGAVFVNDEDTRNKTVAELARTVGTVLQNPDQQLSEATVLHELLFPLREHKRDWRSNTAHAKVNSVIESVGIDRRLLNKDPILLPLAVRKQVTIAQALMLQPDVVILDEPAASFGASARGSLINLLNSLRESGCAVLLIENDLDLVAEIADQITLLRHGQIQLQGSPSSVFATTHASTWRNLGYPLPKTLELSRHYGFDAYSLPVLVQRFAAEKIL